MTVVDEMTDQEVKTVILGLQERHNSATDLLEAVVIEMRSEGQSDS
ncbi:hypothetical protein IQ230_24680 [Gloeocapsopsis crepidinum LEGE 06123]|uniref:Uncharacterized protein n=1 Tax=Gloeocapsopsis crepidinum LEGE 06123 TaxID=588587 RepID=A0ABR9UZQ3_9CHRO|nr:hypothetical protein [Gloeocapsopsis crepidinum LEGE 06123]